MSTEGVQGGGAPVALFHPAFQPPGGAEILVATQAQYLKEIGVDFHVTTMAFDRARWQSGFAGITVRIASSPSWFERFSSDLAKLEHAVPRADALLADYRTVMAVNFPCNVLLGASSTSAKRIWCCTEPSRKLHLTATSPRLHERFTAHPGGTSHIEQDYPKRLAENARMRSSRKGSALVAFDVEMTQKLDVVFSISEFARDTMQRVYGRSDPGILYPMVRFPKEISDRSSGLDRTGLKILTHSRLETPKNVENVVRGFALFFAKEKGARLHVVGEGPERRRLEQLASNLGISSAIRFHGYLSEAELTNVYGFCDVFALQPLDEPFGLVFPEAAARGLLLVGPDHGGPLEITDGGRLGHACDPFEPESVAEAFHQIWALSDTDVNTRRARADEACRSRYSVATIGPELRRALE